MIFPIITFLVAISIAAIAGWFSIAGLMAIFAASAIPVAIMAGSLEVGKLVAASWVYRNWKRAPFLLKSYLTIAVIVLMFITSMGIFGFLSRAHLEQAAEGQQYTARVERIANDIIRNEEIINQTEIKIEKLENETADDTSDIQAQLDAEQIRMNQAYDRVQPAINEQMSIIESEQNGQEEQVKSYLDQISRIDDTLTKVQTYVENEEIKKLQGLVGSKQDGRYGAKTAAKVEAFRLSLQQEKAGLIQLVEDIRSSVDSTAINQAREEIKRLRSIAERDVQNSQVTIDNLRSQLNSVSEIDNSVEIEQLIEKVRTFEITNEELRNEKFELETEVRKLEAEVGPIKYIAELIYGNTERDTVDDAVRWLIIVFIFVFDPLAVLLLIAANYSFINRHNSDGRQEEIFDALFSKKEKKTLDKPTSLSDNISNAEKQRKINTELVKRSGWLDGLKK